MRGNRPLNTVSRYSRPTLAIPVRALLCVLGGALLAVNVQTFVHTGGLLPGGFVGLALLIRESLLRFTGVGVPFGLLYVFLNAVPVVLSWRLVGRRYTALSCLSVAAASLLTGVLPKHFVVGDPALVAVFGGLVQGLSISLCLLAHATSGGTDFVAILLARKYRIDGWWAVLFFNAAVLLAAGFLSGPDKALWSIVFQYVSTQTIRTLYRRYRRHTILAVTNRAAEVAEFIHRETRHGATRLEATGIHGEVPHQIVYSVVDSDEVRRVVNGIHEIDPKGFVNAFKTDFISGYWHERPED
ncbi:MAG: YitT family protein [Kiritimatiellae bacterium]|nr:YitT family protein [Kiritimatiellia bacterium]